MRLFTYLGLVVRRLFAKRGILVGSFLGATLVIALLVIVPLYEASVQAVDLVFTLRGAPADEVDVLAFQNSTAYRGTEASNNRALVEESRQSVIDEWYPTTIERTLSRELIVIPITGAVDWVGLAEQWQETLSDALAAGTPEDELPAAPYPTPPPEALQVRAMTSPEIEERLNAVAGEFPDVLVAPAGENAVLPVAIGTDVARLSGSGVGDRFVLRPFVSRPESFEIVEVVGVVEAADATAKFWGIDDPAGLVYLPLQSFDAWTQPIPADPEADPWLRAERGFPALTTTQRFVLEFEPAAVELEELSAVRGGVTAFNAKMSQETGGTLSSTSFLPLLLDEFSVRSVVIGAPILAILALVVGGALYFLVYTAALTLEREGPEMALLRTRGASTWQTVGIHLAQSLFIALLAALAAPYVARILIGFTGRIPPLSDLTGGEPLRVAQLQSIVPWVAGGAVATFVSMGLAIIPFARRRVLELRSLAARPTGTSVWQRYNLDLFAIALSLVILFQLIQRGFINTTGDEVTLDPLAVVFPVLLLFTGALVLLRLLPWLLRLIGWLMTKVRGMAMALPGWHLGRNPIPYGRLALLVWLTTGFGAFALTYANTLDGSFDDRAAFAVGADLRVVGDDAGLFEVPDGDIAASVYRTSGGPRRTQSRPAEVLAIQPDPFAAVVTWRNDFGPDPTDLFSALRPNGQAPDAGVLLPADATALAMEGVVIPASWAEQSVTDRAASSFQDNTLRWMGRFFDARGRAWTMQADVDWVDSEWRLATMPLDGGLNDYLTPPAPPLALHAIWVERVAPTNSNVTNGESLLVTGLSVVTPSSTVPIEAEVYDELAPVNAIGITREVSALTARDAFFAVLPEGEIEPTAAVLAASPLTREGVAARWNVPVSPRIGSVVPALRSIPPDVNVLLDREAAANAGLSIGDTAGYSVDAQVFSGRLVGLLDEVPTMSDDRLQGKMIVDLDVVSMWFNGTPTWSFNTALSRLTTPAELWVATADTDAALRRINAQLPPGAELDEVLTVAGNASEFSSRPVQVGLVAILFVGAATSILLALAGVTGYVLLAVSRRAREMGVLRALGFPRSSVAATFAVEQVAVLGLGAVIGTAGGIALMWAMIPFLQLGETAENIVPSILLNVDWTVLLLYITVVAGVLIMSVVWATRRVSVRRMSEVLREVER